MLPFFAFVGFIGFMAAIIVFVMKQQAKANAALSDMAARLGLVVVTPPGKLGGPVAFAGVQHGRKVELWSYSTGSGKSRQSWAAVGVRPRGAVRLTFELRPQGWTTKLMELFGSKEITVGDAEFDRMWFVQTNQPEFLAAALVRPVREKLMAERRGSRAGPYRLADGLISYAEMGTFSNAAIRVSLEAKLPLLHDLADIAEVSLSA